MAEEQKTGTSYGNIFKTTFLFGFVQVFKAVISIVKNKIAAVLIGPEGMGLMGIFTSTMDLIRTGAGLGVNQSAVRDVAEAYGSQQRSRYSKIIVVTNRVVLVTGALGCVITLILSKYLSQWTIGDTAHTVSYCVLAFAIAFNIINEGKTALLKGTRRLRHLAYSGMIGSVISIAATVPLFYFFGKDGIVPELLIASVLGLFVTEYFIRKIPFDRLSLSGIETWQNARPMIKMGTALMYVTLLQFAVTFIINSYIRVHGGLSEVGYYNVGTTILNAYFGLVITAISTDYYPRISAVNYDNEKIQEELNRQSIVSIILLGPMFVTFLAFLPLWISLLYSSEFLSSMDYIKYAIYWSLITVCSNQVDMILVAKFNTKVMTIIATVMRLAQLGLSIPFYTLWGLKGLGITFAIMGILHITVMSIVVNKLYGIHYNRKFVKIALFVLIFALMASLLCEMSNLMIRYSIGLVLVVASGMYSLNAMKKELGMDIKAYLKKIK